MASKDLERMYLKGFLASFPHLQLVAEGEAPDFMLRDTEGSIGLEVVLVFRDSSRKGSPAKGLENRRQASLRDLSKRYYELGGKPLSVSALMSRPTLGDLDRLANTLRRLRPTTPWRQRRIRLDQLGATFYLTALPKAAGQYRQWRCASSSVGWVRRAAEDLLSATVAQKARKLATYRKAADRIALLLVADALGTSGMLRATPDVRIPKQGFDAIYFYRHPKTAVQLA